MTEGPEASAIAAALGSLLRAETSCNLYWGEDWVPRAEADLAASREALARIGIQVEAAPDLIEPIAAQTLLDAAPVSPSPSLAPPSLDPTSSTPNHPSSQQDRPSRRQRASQRSHFRMLA